MNILVTGGAGFIGAAICRHLKEHYPHYEITAFDNLRRRGSERNLPDLGRRGIRFIHGDIRNPDDLTNPLTHLDPGSWLAKKVFRLSVPLVLKVTGASPPVVLALPYGCGILLFFFGYKLALQVIRDRMTAVFTASALAFTYFGRAAFFDVGFLWFDGIAYFLLLMAMYAPRGWQVFLFASAAAWADERAFMALSVVMLFHMMQKGTLVSRELSGAFRNPRWLATAAAAGLYLATRFWMQSAYGMETPTAGAHWRVIAQTWPHLPLGSWTFFEGFWLAAAVFFVVAWSRRDFLLPLPVGVLAGLFTGMKFMADSFTLSS